MIIKIIPLWSWVFKSTFLSLGVKLIPEVSPFPVNGNAQCTLLKTAILIFPEGNHLCISDHCFSPPGKMLLQSSSFKGNLTPPFSFNKNILYLVACCLPPSFFLSCVFVFRSFPLPFFLSFYFPSLICGFLTSILSEFNSFNFLSSSSYQIQHSQLLQIGLFSK